MASMADCIFYDLEQGRTGRGPGRDKAHVRARHSLVGSTASTSRTGSTSAGFQAISLYSWLDVAETISSGIVAISYSIHSSTVESM